jgi:hypothetical protein
MSDSIYLPVSLGEAIDKLTILDIKLARITDSRRADVLTEYTLLYDKLATFIAEYSSLYTSMKKINALIWDFMDDLRDGQLEGDAYLKLCKKTVDYNDIRFRIKNKINTVSGSLLKEQKGYKVNSILIDIQTDITNSQHIIRAIQYYSCLYDQVVLCGGQGIKEIFNHDPSLLFVEQVDPNTIFKQTFTVTSADYDMGVDELTMNMIL